MKLSLKVETINENILSISVDYVNICIYMVVRPRLHVSEDGFVIRKGNKCRITERGLTIPSEFVSCKNNINNSYKLSFESEQERYIYLNLLNKALCEFSSSHIFKDVQTEDKQQTIIYYDKYWFVY